MLCSQTATTLSSSKTDLGGMSSVLLVLQRYILLDAGGPWVGNRIRPTQQWFKLLQKVLHMTTHYILGSSQSLQFALLQVRYLDYVEDKKLGKGI